MTDVAAQLDYAPRPTTVRGTWSRRVAVMVGALLLIAGVAWVTPRAARYAQVAYWQSQCLNCTALADQVVFTNDPAHLPILLAPGSGYDGSLAAQEVHFTPPAYRNLAGNFATSFTSGTAFLHRRTSARGDVRLVAISLRGMFVGANNRIAFGARVFEPGGIVRGPRDLTAVTSGGGAAVSLFPGDTCTVYAGQPDPNDASHFTIDYVLNGKRFTLDGWLKDDGSVVIENRE